MYPATLLRNVRFQDAFDILFLTFAACHLRQECTCGDCFPIGRINLLGDRLVLLFRARSSIVNSSVLLVREGRN
jgi:hypothetical protein